MKKKVLFADFDGVLHRVFGPGELTIATAGFGELLEERPDLFGWSEFLAQTLDGHSCQLIVHSSWRAYMRESDLRAVLPPTLRKRFIGVTPVGVSREVSIQSVVRTIGLAPDEFLILDDDADAFRTLQERLVVCDPLRGVSDEAVRLRIHNWLKSP